MGASRSRKPNPITVRVIEYTIAGSSTVYRLATNLLDPNLAPAQELAGLYGERWEIEGCYEELKITQCGCGACTACDRARWRESGRSSGQTACSIS